MVDPNFQATNVSEIAWIAQSCCGRLGCTARGNVKPSEAPKSPATTQLEHFEVCHDGVFACSKSATEVNRSKSSRASFRGEIRGIWRQTCVQRVRRGVLASYGRPQLMRGANAMYEGHSR